MEVLLIAGSEGVHGKVISCPRVHVRVEASFKHLEEGVSHGELLGATQGDVFKDMGFSAVGPGGRSEEDGKGILKV